jgi:type VI secretion system secreted protein VgrG
MARERDVRVRIDADHAFDFFHLRGRETVSRPFAHDIELLSENDQIPLEDVLGATLGLELVVADRKLRHIHGHVTRFAYAGTQGSFARYRVRLEPWLVLLGRTRDQRIFQEKSVVEIVEQIFDEHGGAFVNRLNASYPSREYCVQYGETDLAFVERLLEEEGIFYFFEHAEGRHELVLIDDVATSTAADGYAEVPYFPEDDLARRDRDHLFDWESALVICPGATVMRSYDFTKPTADLEVRERDPRDHAAAEGEVFAFPDRYHDTERGRTLARIRLEECQAEHARLIGHGTAAGLAAGARFKLTGYPRRDQNREYFIAEVAHEIRADALRSGKETPEDEPYRCRIEVQPLDRPFRPLRRHARPLVAGPETAVVTGPAGEEIHTDEHSRVKVQFHWDREGAKDENSSCWIRVSQAWAGPGFGAIVIPRIGQEVVVDFLHGDPDQPLITGRVYNGLAQPPYALPANKTQSGLKSNSSKGGGGSNELRFEDKKGAEEVYLHAEKDENIRVENDKTESVGHDEAIEIGNDRTESVGHDETLSVGNNRSRQVAVDETVAVGGNQTVTIGMNRSDTVSANETRTVALAQQQSVGGLRNVSVGAAQSHQVGASDSWVVGANRSVAIGQSQTTRVGKDRSANIGSNESLDVGQDASFSIGKKLSITAGDEITLTTGKASITMKKDGTIVIKGKDLKIEGSGKIDVKASKNVTMKGQKILQN